ncbi:hypothetical protein H0I76_02875 [Limibaculum sp. M0105]|uniref:Basal-body rod modification protein FlgD n=1 Tax=Thermohalobaculum xanthum TaxID=2753746 RepID=A0A8J7M4E5_9RHOB|nr:flagellar hook capping FlgD N-terminal domain-containing protein [Thermohalobaculum xanthum]MBK0398121.1 hypothetical protein [Thermohalobaculum xanthum]
MNVTTTHALFPSNIGDWPGRDATDDSEATSDFETFLTLLTAQLRNQDPMQPIDSTEFVAQLASFTTAEQLVGVNERLDGLQVQGAASEIAALGAWIGKEIAATDGSFRALGGPMAFGVPVNSAADGITARVLNASGDEIARFPLEGPNLRSGVWDGRAANGAFVQDQDVKIVLDYSVGGTVIAQQPASVFRKVVAIRGTAEGIVLDLADGGTLDASRIGQLRDPDAPEPPLAS